MKSLSKEKIKQAFTRLDELLPRSATLLIGGGGAMILAHNFELATADVDAVAKGMTSDEIDHYVKKIALEQGLPGDWLNPYFSTFTHYLPEDYQTRLVEVFVGKRLLVQALGREDLLVMKCFAHRRKDILHARALVRAGANIELVSKQIERLEKNRIPGTKEAFDFLDEVVELES